ncbi:hypothetical protein AYO21_09193 [Fonsecaea monophora]|uniref:Uncharacterized protein n=1 Tax=Fonsecaea monophora TaxID=254056 RepID=A0A177EX62_9EURO|nr:hypothetical protein AYO21_09193 [Fonsecaea monophora]KAH0846180.1 hypothetical protein FOPE_11339 [Fonsecaea pedrosoi]OAG36633.1 hypothetical protein AYO21_09193 [Fonsecaea monophora]
MQSLISRRKHFPLNQNHQSNLIQPDTHRLKVAIDFGTTTSSICYDEVAGVEPLQSRKVARNVVCNPYETTRHRVPSTAVVHEDIASGGRKRLVLKFGENLDADRPHGVLAEITLMKLSLLPLYLEKSSDRLTVNMLNSLKARHQDALRKIQFEAVTSDMYTQDPLTGQFRLCAVNSMEDLITLFFEFLWHLTMRHCAAAYGIGVEDVTSLFHESVDVAISVPSIGLDDSPMGNYQQLLNKAGYPKNTCILFEGKSAGLFHLVTEREGKNDRLDQVERQRASIIVDIGGGTTDICFVRPSDINDETVMLGSSLGLSVVDGSLKLNELFKEHLRQEVPEGLLQYMAEFPGTESDLLDAFAADFEIQKRDTGTHLNDIRIQPHCGALKVTKELHGDTFKLTEDGLFLRNFMLRRLFDMWLDNIFRLVDEEVREARLYNPGVQSVTICLAGWGSRPPYVLEAFGNRYRQQGTTVVMVQDLDQSPAVAQGNFLSLASQMIIQKKVARATFGTRLHTSSSFRHVNTHGTQWVVLQGTDLDDPRQQSSLTRTVVTENPVFPLTLKFDIMSDTEFQWVENEGKVQIEFESLGSCGFRLEQRGDGVTVLKVQYSVHVCYRGMVSLMVLTVPHTGDFDNTERNRNLDMIASQPINIQKHAARMDNINDP